MALLQVEEIGYLLKNKTTNAYKPVMADEYWNKWTPQERDKYWRADNWGKTLYDRRGGVEWHQASLGWLSAETEPGSGTTYFDVMNGSWQWFIWNLDGCTDLNGYCVPGTPWTGPTNGELASWCRAAFHRGDAWCEYFPMEVFVLDRAMLVEDEDRINWEHLDIIREEWENR